MRLSPLALRLGLAGLLFTAVPALADAPATAPAAKPVKKPVGPRKLGAFEDWTAAIDKQPGQTVCYAFARPKPVPPQVSGRGDVVLTVTVRPNDATARLVVALSAGFPYAANAVATLSIDQTVLEFYTSQRSAFARDDKAAVQAFMKGKQAVVRSPGPKSAVTDTFSLKGFSAAYAAIVKACPVGKTAP